MSELSVIIKLIIIQQSCRNFPKISAYFAGSADLIPLYKFIVIIGIAVIENLAKIWSFLFQFPLIIVGLPFSYFHNRSAIIPIPMGIPFVLWDMPFILIFSSSRSLKLMTCRVASLSAGETTTKGRTPLLPPGRRWRQYDAMGIIFSRSYSSYTARSMIGYWHHNVVSVCPSSMAKWYITSAKVSEQVTRKWHEMPSKNTTGILQLSSLHTDPEHSNFPPLKFPNI